MTDKANSKINDRGTAQEKKSTFNKLKIDLLALIVSILALGIAILDGYQSRKENKLLLQPKIDFVINLASQGEFIGLALKNNGLGPAQIFSFEVFYGEELVGYDTTESWVFIWNYITKDYGEIVGGEHIYVLDHFTGSNLPSGQTEIIYGFDNKDFSNINKENLRLVLQNTKIKITYKSVLGDTHISEYEYEKL